uniref:Uncharacterized protein n=1 Tax=Podoviridae sp. ctsNK10 TaxID=2826582 RepID=A0A8S5NLS3_9CAUD|nr:MAG TPA: hypothetical protein [Podoviridae sp. ctsNK10]
MVNFSLLDVFIAHLTAGSLILTLILFLEINRYKILLKISTRLLR